MLSLLSCINQNYILIFQFNSRIFENLNNNINILNNNFVFLHSITNGGAILINNYNFNISIQFSIFSNCFSELNGGCIYIKLINSNICFSKLCFSNSSIEKNQKNMINYLETSENNLIEHNLISFMNSIDYTNSIYYSFSFQKGITNVKSINSSNNQVYIASGIYFYNSNLNNMTFSNFINNNATLYHCILFDNSNGNIFQNNFFNNQCNLESGLIQSAFSSNVICYECIFLQNHFCTFETWQSSILIINRCYSDSYYIYTTRSVNIVSPLGITNLYEYSKILNNICIIDPTISNNQRKIYLFLILLYFF